MTMESTDIKLPDTQRKEQNRRVFGVANELKVTTPAIIEYLESKNFDVKRGPMTQVTDEMYMVLLQKFDLPRFQRLQLEQTSTRQHSQKEDSDRLRAQEQAELLAARKQVGKTTAEVDKTADDSKRKIDLPHFSGLKVIERAPEPPPVPEIAAEPEDLTISGESAATLAQEALETAAIPSAEQVSPVESGPDVLESVSHISTKRTPDKSEEQVQAQQPASVEASVQPAPTVGEPVRQEVQKPRKIELPQPKSLVIVEKAPHEQVPADRGKKVATEPVKAETTGTDTKADKSPRKKLKRKKLTTKVETKEDALEVAVDRQLHRENEKRTKTKSTTIKGDSVDPKRRKRKRRKKGATPVEAAPVARKQRDVTFSEKDVAASIRQTMAKVEGRGAGKKKHIRTAKDEEYGPQIAKITEFATTQEFANVVNLPVQEVIKRSLELGTIISINQRLDRDMIEVLAAEFSTDIEFVLDEDILEVEDELDDGNFVPRQPVVTVMGHVDHGKTTLLDYLRRTHVAEREAGGITQHIGAYEVKYNDNRITFLDTPGHEAFTAMRARGAQVTDIVVLIVAADDRVMPQTLEAIDHARAAGVPIVIAVNKVDKPEANVDSIYKQLADQNILVEKWGGKYQAAEISAKFGKGIPDLLAEILVAADLLELRADPEVNARGIVVESQLDRGLGALATLLVQHGTLRVGDIFVVGQHFGKVRSMYDEIGNRVDEVGPGRPARVVGFSGVPQAGDKLTVYQSEKEAREVSQRRQRQQREMSMRQIRALTLDQVSKRMQEEQLKELPLLIKGDVHGSVEVLSDSLMKLSNNEVTVNIIHRGVGGITESDILLAAASSAIIIGFHVHPNPQARETARREGVEIRIYRIIHEVVDEVRKSLEGLLAPLKEEHEVGELEVRQVFHISRIGSIAGCYVTSGKINRNNRVRLIRDDIEIWSGELDSLKRFKDDVKEVATGFECGVALAGYPDLKEGDRIQAFEVIEKARTLVSNG